MASTEKPRPCKRAGWPVTLESKSIQTCSMPSLMASELPQLRSLGWKIHSRCCSSRVEQPPASKATRAVAEAKRDQDFIGRLNDSRLRKKFNSRLHATAVPVSSMRVETLVGRPTCDKYEADGASRTLENPQ